MRLSIQIGNKIYSLTFGRKIPGYQSIYKMYAMVEDINNAGSVVYATLIFKLFKE